MLGKNVPTKFKTSLESIYEVYVDGMIRRKYDGTIHKSEKNIFYATETGSSRLLELTGEGRRYRVEVEGDKAVFWFGQQTTVTTYKTPKLKDWPVDMLLTPEGKPDPKGDGFHCGHAIKEFL